MPKTCILKPGLSDGELMKNIKNFGCEEMVIKPAVGASGKGTLRLDHRTMSQKTKKEILKMSKIVVEDDFIKILKKYKEITKNLKMS